MKNNNDRFALAATVSVWWQSASHFDKNSILAEGKLLMNYFQKQWSVQSFAASSTDLQKFSFYMTEASKTSNPHPHETA